MLVDFARRRTRSLDDDVDAAVTQTPLQPGLKSEFSVEEFTRRTLRFHMKVDIPALHRVIQTGTEQPYEGVRAKYGPHFLLDDPLLIFGQSHVLLPD